MRWPALGLVCLFYLMSACASKVLQLEEGSGVGELEEFEQLVEVKEIPVEPSESLPKIEEYIPPSSKEMRKDTKDTEIKPEDVKKEEKKIVKEKEKKITKEADVAREPHLEDAEGFIGRRPKVDPFRPGERVRLNLSYFNMVAGHMDLEVGNFVEVNERKAYSFSVHARSSRLFSRFYSVDDKAVTYVDYEKLRPYSHSIHVKESRQVAEIRSFFDWDKLQGSYWHNKMTKDRKEQNRKVEWEIEPYAQNVISAAFYLRTFQLIPGKSLAFRVADDGKNMIFTGEVLRREVLNTELGDLDTVVVKPTIEIDGVFKPMGDIYLWLTDDDRKFIVRIDSKIRIGTIRARLESIEPGRVP